MAEAPELERRIAELEYRLDEYGSRDPNTFADDFMTSVERRIFKMLVGALDELTPGLSDVLRRHALSLEEDFADRIAEQFPQMSPLKGWMKMRAKEIIDEMLPSPEEG